MSAVKLAANGGLLAAQRDLLRRRWSTLGAREQRIVAGGAIALTAALLFAFGWLPIQRARADLALRLPELRAKVAAMQRQAAEVKQLRTLPPAAAAGARALDGGAVRSAFSGTQVVVTPLDGGRFKLAIADTPYAAWIDELARLAAQTGARPEEAAVTALPGNAGRVRIEAVLGGPR